MYGWYSHPMSGVWWTAVAALTILFATLLTVGLTSWRRHARESSTPLESDEHSAPLESDETSAPLATQRFTYGLSANRHTRARARERAKHS